MLNYDSLRKNDSNKCDGKYSHPRTDPINAINFRDLLGNKVLPTEVRPSYVGEYGECSCQLYDNYPYPFQEPTIGANLRFGTDLSSLDLSIWLLMRLPNFIRQEGELATMRINQILDVMCKYIYDPTFRPNIPYFNTFTPNVWVPPDGERLANWWNYREVFDDAPYTGSPRTPQANEHPSDTPFSPQDGFSTIGRFDVKLGNVSVLWRNHPDELKRCYYWVADLEIYNTYGTSTGDIKVTDAVMNFNPISRHNKTIKIGSFSIDGEGCCCPQFWSN